MHYSIEAQQSKMKLYLISLALVYATIGDSFLVNSQCVVRCS